MDKLAWVLVERRQNYTKSRVSDTIRCLDIVNHLHTIPEFVHQAIHNMMRTRLVPATRPTGVSSLFVLCLKGAIVLLFLWVLLGIADSLLDVVNEQQNITAHFAEIRAIYREQCTNSLEVSQSTVRASECASKLEYIMRVKRRGTWNIAVSNYMQRRRWCTDTGCESINSLAMWALLFIAALFCLFVAVYKLVDALNRWSQSRSSNAGYIGALAHQNCTSIAPPTISAPIPSTALLASASHIKRE